MTLHDRLEEVFQTVFGDEISLSDQTTASDIPGWDSVATINLMFSIEQAFGVQFSGSEFTQFKNVGDLKQFLLARGA